MDIQMQASAFFRGTYPCTPCCNRILQLHYSRLAIPIQCRGLNGFGAKSKSNENQSEKKKKKNSSKKKPRRATLVKDGSPQLTQIMKEVDKGKLDIDPEVATKGKVDFVRVESWGNASDPESGLENLKMKSFSPSFTSLDEEAPFYEQIVLRLQLLEAKGDIAVVQAKPLPPFERWLFHEHNYLQFLVDQIAVYSALENAISSVKQARCIPEYESSSTGTAAMAVSIFGKELGLNRSEALNADIESIHSVMISKSGKNAKLPKTTIQTLAYAKYIGNIGKIASSEENWKEGCLRLLSHIFAIHVTHLTTGMRIGAKAVDSFPSLVEARAVNFYRDYPQQATDPLKLFIAAINKAGEFINSDDREQAVAELPKAIQKTSLLLAVLAVE